MYMQYKLIKELQYRRFWHGLRSVLAGGLCRGAVLLGPGPRSLCVAPFASGPSLCL